MKDLLANARDPVVLLSGGMDSLVVLDWALSVRKVPVVTFAQNFSKEQWQIIKNIILAYDLECFTFPPSHSYVIPNGGLARVDEYTLGPVVLPVVRDFIDGDRCSLELDEKKLDIVPFHYDVVFTGSKRSDVSLATGPSPFKNPVVNFGDITFAQPLYDKSDAEVREMGKHLPYSTEFYDDGDERYDTGNILACSLCLSAQGEKVFCPKTQETIETVKWDAEASLEAFRAKFGFEVNYAN